MGQEGRPWLPLREQFLLALNKGVIKLRGPTHRQGDRSNGRVNVFLQLEAVVEGLSQPCSQGSDAVKAIEDVGVAFLA
jgi:hypothetical protein